MNVLRSILNRRPWTRRKWLPLALILLFVLALRLAWGWWVGMRVESALNELRERGVPVQLADIDPPQVPDNENAVAFLRKASAAARNPSVESPRHGVIEYPDYPPYPAEWMELAASSEQAHRHVFTLLRQARLRTRIQWRTGAPAALPTVITVHPLAQPYGDPILSDVKWLANLVTDGAIYAHVNGQDVEAIDRLLDLLHMARLLHHDDSEDAQSVAIGVNAIACFASMVIAPGVRFDQPDGKGAVVRGRVRELIDRLLDAEASRDGMRRAAAFHRLIWIKHCRELARDTWAIRPLADHNILRALPVHELVVRAAEQRTAPEAQLMLDRAGMDPLSWYVISHCPTEPGVPRYSRWFPEDYHNFARILERHFRAIGERRATAVSLALQLHRAEHGRWPERLDELVPNHLDEIPSDPHHANGQSIGYVILRGGLPDGGDRPMVYFDAGTIEPEVSKEPQYSWRAAPIGKAVRQYRDVTRFTPAALAPSPPPPPPPPPPAPDAEVEHTRQAELLRNLFRGMGLKLTVNDDPHQPDAPGQDEEEENGVP